MGFEIPEPILGFFDRISLGKALRFLVTLAAIVLPTVGYITSYLQTKADETVVQSMKAHGMDPESFKDMQQQLKATANSAHAADVQNTVIQSDIASMKAQNRLIIDMLTKKDQ